MTSNDWIQLVLYFVVLAVLAPLPVELAGPHHFQPALALGLRLAVAELQPPVLDVPLDGAGGVAHQVLARHAGARLVQGHRSEGREPVAGAAGGRQRARGACR